MREEAVHADLLHRWIENKLALSVLMQDRVVVFDGYATKGLAVCYHTISKHAIVRGIRDCQQAHPRQE